MVTKNYTGFKSGKLTVKELHHRDKWGVSFWSCECDCGNSVIRPISALKKQTFSSCGKCEKGSRFIDRTGQTFGELTVIAEAPKNKRRQTVWQCRCNCGAIVDVAASRLAQGQTTCNADIHRKGVNSTHNMSKTSEYKSWCGMKERCYNRNNLSYPNWGGRGIKVCDRWINSFENFFADMGHKPSSKHSIDRIDNNGDYTPENCRWATQQQQVNNTRQNRVATIGNKTDTISNWAKHFNISLSAIYRRLYKGMSEEDAIKDLL